MKRPWVLVTLIVAIVIISVGASYVLLERKWQVETAKSALVEVAMLVKIARTLQGEPMIVRVKDSLDAAIDRNLRWLIEYEGAYRSDSEFVRSRNEILLVLRKYWDESPPFVGDKWTALRSDAAWMEQHKRKSQFLESLN